MNFELSWESLTRIDVLLGVLAGLLVGYLAGAQVRRVRSIGSLRPRRKPGSPDCVEIYVGNLSYETAEDQLRREFERYGKVKSARIISNRFNRKSKGFGFVEMPNRPEAEAAIKALHDKEIQGRKLRVNEARNKTP
jgi:RNA recognition motif-containing protein